MIKFFEYFLYMSLFILFIIVEKKLLNESLFNKTILLILISCLFSISLFKLSNMCFKLLFSSFDFSSNTKIFLINSK